MGQIGRKLKKEEVVMGKVILVLSVIGLCFFYIAPLEARELEEAGETLIDTLTGDNPSAPLLISEYVAKTWEAVNIPIIGKQDVRGKLEYIHDSHNLTDRNSLMVSVGLEL